MKQQDLIYKIQARRKVLGITLMNLAKLSDISYRTLTRFVAGTDTKFSYVERVTQTLGLDFAGNKEVTIQTLKEKRAEEKALYIVGLVQDTSSLENQGLDKEHIEELLEETKQSLLMGEYKDKLWST